MNPPDIATSTPDAIRKIEAYLRSPGPSTGMKADLRRIDPLGNLTNPSLHRVLAMYVPEHWVASEDQLRRWALIIQVSAHQAKIDGGNSLPVGAAAYRAKIKETRLTTFLRSEGRSLFGAVGRISRFAGSAGVRMSLVELGEFILAANDRARHDALSSRIAEDFYRAEATDPENKKNSAAAA